MCALLSSKISDLTTHSYQFFASKISYLRTAISLLSAKISNLKDEFNTMNSHQPYDKRLDLEQPSAFFHQIIQNHTLTAAKLSLNS
jgi:hypothetical protein